MGGRCFSSLILRHRVLGLPQPEHDRHRQRGSNNVVELPGELLSQSRLLDTRDRAVPSAHRVPVRFNKHRAASRLPLRLRRRGRDERARKPNDDVVRLPRK